MAHLGRSPGGVSPFRYIQHSLELPTHKTQSQNHNDLVRESTSHEPGLFEHPKDIVRRTSLRQALDEPLDMCYGTEVLQTPGLEHFQVEVGWVWYLVTAVQEHAPTH